MLHTFRNAAKTWVVKLLFALLALSFVAWGVGDVVRRGALGTGPAIVVGSVDVSSAEVETEFKRQIERMQPQFKGQLTEDVARKIGFLDQTIQTITTRLLVDGATSSLGLAASDDTVLKSVINDPNLKNEQGQMDRERLRASLARMGMTEVAFLKMERADQTRKQLAGAVTGGIAAPMTLVDPLARRKFEQRVADTVIVSDSAVAAPAAPSAEELETYYQANKSRFMAPEYRALTVLRLRPADVEKQVQISDEDLAAAYDQRQADFNVPEKRQSSQILVSDQGKADLAAELVQQGRDLTTIAKTLDAKIIDLGVVTKSELPTELQDTVFTTAPGTTAGPVRSDLGWHVIKVFQIVPAQIKTLDQVKPQLVQAVRHDKIIDLLAELSNKVDDALGGGASIEEAARRFNLTVTSFDAVDAKGLGTNHKPVEGLPADPSFLNSAFHTDQGSESQMSENGQDGYYLVRVDGVTAPAPHPLAQIKTEIQAAWSATKRHQLAKAKAEAIAPELKSTGLAGVNRGPGIELKTTQPFTRDASDASGLPAAAVAKVFDSAEGDVATTELPDAWIVTRLAQVKPAELTAHPEQIDRVKHMAAQALAGDISETFLSALETKVGVKVDRSQLMHEE